MDGRPNRRKKPAFSNSFDLVWTLPKRKPYKTQIRESSRGLSTGIFPRQSMSSVKLLSPFAYLLERARHVRPVVFFCNFSFKPEKNGDKERRNTVLHPSLLFCHCFRDFALFFSFLL